MIALAGCSGTGKTTLAQFFALKTGTQFVPSVVREVYDSMGLDPRIDYGFDTRLEVQRAILAQAKNSYDSANRMFICDRSPLDFAAYTLADVGRLTLTAGQTAKMADYLDECFDLANAYFTNIVVVQPGIPFSVDLHRPANPMYNAHVNALIMGLTLDQRLKTRKTLLDRDTLSLEKRFEALLDVTSVVVGDLIKAAMPNARIH